MRVATQKKMRIRQNLRQRIAIHHVTGLVWRGLGASSVDAFLDILVSDFGVFGAPFCWVTACFCVFGAWFCWFSDCFDITIWSRDTGFVCFWGGGGGRVGGRGGGGRASMFVESVLMKNQWRDGEEWKMEEEDVVSLNKLTSGLKESKEERSFWLSGSGTNVFVLILAKVGIGGAKVEATEMSGLNTFAFENWNCSSVWECPKESKWPRKRL